MASSDGLASVDLWSFRQSFNNIDSWLLPDPFSHDSDILSKALHKSISDPLPPSPYFDSDLSPPQTISNVSFGSDPDVAAVAGGDGGLKRKRGPGVSGGKPAKRRSRVSTKKSQTTFITADAANFRQMVQQVTGAKFIGSSHGFFAPVVKPEPHRLATRVPFSAVPTLDTSSFLSNHQQENMVTEVGSVSAHVSSAHVSSAGVGGGSAVELDSYPSFPTLESWKVM
ncbi:unnamed protein product [Eruca vesicaria subsp. sativa]|uniref:VQ domain-containing protein n=1 Tax=Eruca vesicaria subsp. sativa TaxID=29727 RepID=A0ABC8KW17_ERUVS|nr:unnamed protein product [Eruca vesicaria subsp. sativa]